MPRRIPITSLFIGKTIAEQLNSVKILRESNNGLAFKLEGLDVRQHIRSQPIDALIKTLRDRGFTNEEATAYTLEIKKCLTKYVDSTITIATGLRYRFGKDRMVFDYKYQRMGVGVGNQADSVEFMKQFWVALRAVRPTGDIPICSLTSLQGTYQCLTYEVLFFLCAVLAISFCLFVFCFFFVLGFVNFVLFCMRVILSLFFLHTQCGVSQSQHFMQQKKNISWRASV